MRTLNQFKQELGVTSIELMKGNGRMYATVGDKSIIVGNTTDMVKPLFVVYNEDKGFYCIVNSSAKVVATI